MRIWACDERLQRPPKGQGLLPTAAALIPGVDANKDGRVSWEQGEGGLQQSQTHMDLMKKGESLP